MFFTYVDCKPDGTPFYIGKGRKARLSVKSRVNRHHANICAKYPSWYRGIAFMGSEQDAFKKEVELIAKYRETVVNRTNGGEGVSGLKPWNKGKPMLPHVKEKLRSVNIGRKSSEFQKEAVRKAATGNKHAVGYKHTEEALLKMSKASQSHVRTPEWKAKIAESIKQHWILRRQEKL